MEYESLFKAARQAGTLLAETETERLGRTLMHAAQLLRTHTPCLLEANARDLEAMAPDSPLRDRLRLTPERIAAIAADMEAVAHLPSPQGEEAGAAHPAQRNDHRQTTGSVRRWSA